jgi:uncharacterized protein involved in response to NO
MTTTAEKVRSYRGPAILSYGFRPFFLLGAIWSALASDRDLVAAALGVADASYRTFAG